MEQNIWHCPICGQDFPGDQPPERCPICGAGASVFTKVGASAAQQWRCLVCGQVFEGAEPPVPCPVCGAGRQAFEPQPQEEEPPRQDTDRRFVLIGGGAAGLECAKAIRRRDKTASITLICGEKQAPYNRPALSDALADGLSLAALLLQEPQWYEEQAIRLLTGVCCTEILREQKQVRLDNGETLPYDKLLLAAGSQPFLPLKPQEGAVPLYALRSYEDCLRLTQAAQGAKKVVILGGGILGVEAALALRERGLRVTIAERGPHILTAQADENAAALTADWLNRRGISIRCGVAGEALLPEGLRLNDGSVLEADFVLAAAGVRPQVALAQACGLATDRGVLTDETMVTSDPDIYAAGDCAQFQDRPGGLWSEAAAQGQVAGAQMAGDSQAVYTRPVPAAALEENGLSLFSCGLTRGARLQTLTYEDAFSGVYKRLFLEDGKIVGGILFGDTSQAGQLLNWVASRRQAPASILES